MYAKLFGDVTPELFCAPVLHVVDFSVKSFGCNGLINSAKKCRGHQADINILPKFSFFLTFLNKVLHQFYVTDF